MTRIFELETFFVKWARTINLVSPTTFANSWHRHILDSAQLWCLRQETAHWLDLGSGSGFPGLVLAALSKDKGLRSTFVESNAKKSAYLRQAISYLKLDARVRTERVEELEPEIYARSGTTITARAFAPLERTLAWTRGFGSPVARALLHKGRGYKDEISAARGSWHFDLIEHPSLVDSDSVILDITGVRRL